MIPVVDDYLSELIQEKMSYLKNNVALTDSLLGLNANRLNSLKTYLAQNQVRITKGYPRTPAELPCVCILLSNEEETQMGLGDYGEGTYDTENQGKAEADVVFPISGDDIPYPYCRVTGFSPLTSIRSVTNVSTGWSIPSSHYYLANGEMGLIAFTSTEYVEDGDVVEVDFDYWQYSSEDLETMFDLNFRLEVWTSNGDLTVELYHLVKWALLSGRDDLVQKGLFRQRLSGTDFEPATSWFPEFVYRRALSFWCQAANSVPLQQVEYIQSVGTNQSVIVEK